MRSKIPLFIAIAMIAADIAYVFIDRFWVPLNFEFLLFATNAALILYLTASYFYLEKQHQAIEKLPLPIVKQAPSYEISDRLLIRHFPGLLCLKDKDGRWLTASTDYLEDMGLETREYHGKTDFELAQSGDCAVEALKNGSSLDKQCWEQKIPLQALRETASGLTLEETRTPIFDLDENPLWILITARPASEFDQKKARLEWLDRALITSHIPYAIIAQDFRIINSNKAFGKITGYTPEELLGNPLTMLIDKWEGKKTLPLSPNILFSKLRSNTGAWLLDCLHKQGRTFHARIEMSAVPLADEGFRYLATLHDISEQVALENQLKLYCQQDDLTGLSNRQQFFERLGQFLATSQRYGFHVVALHINLDRFKTVNESMGHSAGDELLRQVGKRLLEMTRQGDVVARLSGDEFGVLLMNDKDQERAVYTASMIARKVIQNLTRAFHIQYKEIFIGASVGIAIYPEDGARPEQLLKNADTAMKAAKNIGSSSYLFYRKDYTTSSLDRLTLEMDLRKAISRNELQLYFQPQYMAKERILCGAEVLIRWFPNTNGETKMIPPYFFIPVAEDSGLIIEIGKWTLKTACEQIKKWHEDGLLLPQVAVNISARQFNDPNFIDVVEESLKEAQLDAEHLELEITESMLVGDVKRIELQLRRLKKMGILIALDDFGTGYSSLSYLKNFPVDVLKIDQSFIREMTNDSRDANIARAIIEMGHSLGQKIVAEGVETEEQLLYLARRDCDIIQGYYFSPPLSAGHMTQLLRQEKDKISPLRKKSLIH